MSKLITKTLSDGTVIKKWGMNYNLFTAISFSSPEWEAPLSFVIDAPPDDSQETCDEIEASFSEGVFDDYIKHFLLCGLRRHIWASNSAKFREKHREWFSQKLYLTNV